MTWLRSNDPQHLTFLLSAYLSPSNHECAKPSCLYLSHRPTPTHSCAGISYPFHTHRSRLDHLLLDADPAFLVPPSPPSSGRNGRCRAILRNVSCRACHGELLAIVALTAPANQPCSRSSPATPAVHFLFSRPSQLQISAWAAWIHEPDIAAGRGCSVDAATRRRPLVRAYAGHQRHMTF